jgi:hypothetical protein
MTRAYSHLIQRLLAFMAESAAGRAVQDIEFNDLALALYDCQFAQISAYRRLAEMRGTKPGSVHTWQDIPALPTSAFKDWELTCLAPHQRKRVFFSSGTTGRRPSRHFHNEESLRLYEASLGPWFAKHLLPDGSSHLGLVALVPPSDQAPRSSLVYMLDTIARRFEFRRTEFIGRVAANGAWELDCGVAVGQIEACAESNQPVLIAGTAFSYVHLLDFLRDEGPVVRLPPGSRAMETGGYKGRSRALAKADLHALISDCLGIPPTHIVTEYGMSELSSQAYDGPVAEGVSVTSRAERRVFHFPPWVRVQIVSPETGLPVGEGESGLLGILDLANVFSVAAVQTEDLARRSGGGFELIGRTAKAEPRGCSLMAR